MYIMYMIPFLNLFFNPWRFLLPWILPQNIVPNFVRLLLIFIRRYQTTIIATPVALIICFWFIIDSLALINEDRSVKTDDYIYGALQIQVNAFKSPIKLMKTFKSFFIKRCRKSQTNCWFYKTSKYNYFSFFDIFNKH